MVELTAAAVRRRVAQGGVVVVFDGLDEVLVRLDPPDQGLSTRQLFRVVDAQSISRMLLTSRTQCFRTIREEVGYFLGRERAGLRGANYLSLLMLPFRTEQVREYLAANLAWDEEQVDDLLATIAAVHDLTDLARRPVTLRMIADHVGLIERAKMNGTPVRAVSLYGEFVDGWLERDEGKHALRPRHKRFLMEHIAARLARDGRASWSADEVDDWLIELIDGRSDLKRRYRPWEPERWAADFRTATFLSRNGDAFAFAHRSFGEYFLAQYLYRELTESAMDALAMPVPSPETLDFLGQSIAALPAERRATALATLARIGTRYIPQASELALAYALQAERQLHPRQPLDGVVLAGAQLSGLRFGGPGGGRPLSLARANLSGADLRDAVFVGVDLTGANLSGADLTGRRVPSFPTGREPPHGRPRDRHPAARLHDRRCRPGRRGRAPSPGATLPTGPR
jgi:Pentapeptide repeats (8 copies)